MPSFTPTEKRASLALAGVFSLRMFGLFVILPVLAIYASNLSGGANATGIGIAIGIYGLTQAVFQIPFGRLSDFWGRKRTIYLGLLIFIIGSIVAALAESLLLLSIGRAIQGAGAVSAVVIALVADLTRDSVRTKAMAIIGVTIGFTFLLSIITGPLLQPIVGVPGIFLITAIMSGCAIFVVHFLVPENEREQVKASVRVGPKPLRAILTDANLLRLDFGIFSLHGILMSMFIAVPFFLSEHTHVQDVWKFYLYVMVASLGIMLPLIRIAEKFELRKPVFIVCVGLIFAVEVVLWGFEANILQFGIAMVAFFGAFNVLEALLPSWVSRVAHASSKGTALGVYSTSQYLGTFFGGLMGGVIYQSYAWHGVFLFCAGWAIIWLMISLKLQDPIAESYD